MKSISDKKSIFEKVKQLGQPLGKYIVVGGAMEAHGIREAKDIDIVVTKDLFEQLLQYGWKECDCQHCKEELKRGGAKKTLKGDGVDILSEYSWKDKYQADTEELIRKADIIKGIPFVQLKELLKWKKAARREKDINDIELIKQFLQKNNNTTK